MKPRIFNCTQHQPTADQIADGVESTDTIIVDAITFAPSQVNQSWLKLSAERVTERLIELGAKKDSRVMIGGAPYFMATLEKALLQAGMRPLYALSERVSKDVLQADGTMTKSVVFRHEGFYEVKK